MSVSLCAFLQHLSSYDVWVLVGGGGLVCFGVLSKRQRIKETKKHRGQERRRELLLSSLLLGGAAFPPFRRLVLLSLLLLLLAPLPFGWCCFLEREKAATHERKEGRKAAPPKE